MIQSSSAEQAKSYFSDALMQSDYYTNDQELKGKLVGRLAGRLKVAGYVSKEIFCALAENIQPETGKPLTPRSKQDRTVGYDINFHCSKSVSILHALSKDTHILDAFEATVAETMQDIEADSQTRVRKNGQDENRQTGELVWASFTHQTARPVKENPPDPHLHSHCFVFNATWDEEEKEIKAAQFRNIKRDMPYYQARFHKRLSDTLINLGYQIRLTNTSFEVEGVPQSVIDLFSKRTDEIGRVAKENGITNAEELDKLGARTRARKKKGLNMLQLRQAWREQIRSRQKETDGEEKNPTIRFSPFCKKIDLTAKDCIAHAIRHSFERASVVQDRRLLATAYRHAIGYENVDVDSISQTLEEEIDIIRVQEGNQTRCTTREVLNEEHRMVELAKRGIGKLRPLYSELSVIHATGQQAEAIHHVLTTSNRVSIIRGAAGTGKTTLMREAVRLMEKQGKKVIVVAPTAEASRGVLQSEGFAEADTVAHLLSDERKQSELTNQVLWVDEAGLLGTGDMLALLDLAEKHKAQLILGGDTRQHASVVRGDALRILNTIGNIQPAEVSKIYRQKDARYRDAVENLSKGNIIEAFAQLDTLEAIQTIDPLKPNEKLVDDYIGAIKKGKTALVISPTHSQCESVTDDLRLQLRQEGLIDSEEILGTRLINLNFTAAQKIDRRNYKKGQAIQFNQNLPGLQRGSICDVESLVDGYVIIKRQDGKVYTLPVDQPDKFDVFEKSAIGLSKGDKIRITRNAFDLKDRRLNNGQTLEVTSVNAKGQISLKNNQSKIVYELNSEFGHLSHALCITSHASQGKTVDEVFISQPSATFTATDAKQFYVSVSRARNAVHIYTDDKIALLEQAADLNERQSALELVMNRKAHQKFIVAQERRKPFKNHAQIKSKSVVPQLCNKAREYELQL